LIIQTAKQLKDLICNLSQKNKVEANILMMNNDYLINTVEMDCPICNRVHLVEQRKRLTQSIVKDKVVNYEEIYFLCPLSDKEENEFVPAGLMDENLLRARDSYRKKYGDK